jgi:hypothetical protein
MPCGDVSAMQHLRLESDELLSPFDSRAMCSTQYDGSFRIDTLDQQHPDCDELLLLQSVSSATQVHAGLVMVGLLGLRIGLQPMLPAQASEVPHLQRDAGQRILSSTIPQ